MAFNIQTFCLLVVAALFNGGLTAETKEQSKQLVSARINPLFDQYIPLISEVILKSGLEPMSLMDYGTRIGVGKAAIDVNLNDGFLHNLSKLKRSKDAVLYYYDKRLLVDVTLAWTELSFDYNYKLDWLIFERTGYVDGKLKNADLNIRILVDLEHYEIVLQSVQAGKVEEIDINFDGHLSDVILNKVSKAVTKYLKRAIVKYIEDKAIMLAQPAIEDLNKRIKKIIKQDPSENEFLNHILA